MLIRIEGIKLPPGKEELLADEVAAALAVPRGAFTGLRIARRSLDARRRKPPVFIYTVEVEAPAGMSVVEKITGAGKITEAATATHAPCRTSAFRPKERPVVIGCGPAGIFAAFTLAMNGVPVILLERGKEVAQRTKDVRAFWEKGVFQETSNVHFGEGGAGTFSDGKLTSRARNPYTPWLKKVLVEMGAPAEILFDAKPHIGTDRLREVVINLRERLIEFGCEVRFGAWVTDFLVHRGKIGGVVVNDSEEIRTGQVILAMGQSADDTYRKLSERGVVMAVKPFAMGLRVEHPQELINEIQYGRWANQPSLPPADYFLTAKTTAPDRSVYTFCMCPGGRVIGSSAEAGGIVTNGMSRYLRDGNYANSAVVVGIRAEDMENNDPLSGLAFRRTWEAKAFLLGGGNYCAPAQRLLDFLADRESVAIAGTSFHPGVRAAPLRDALPPFVVDALKRGLSQFEKNVRGFITAEANLLGVETRTSSPVRIVRDESGQSVSVEGLYPCGEGAGYAGGIISSALDGVRAAEAIIDG